ncbi:IS1634 family transposase, partial [Vibrio vulnificus]|nr:IS1634 family transposase [Vibrio vulnificus]
FPSMVKNKTTSKPTARWVFLKFEGIDTLELGDQRFITGVRNHQTRLLKLLGKIYEAVYS